MGVAANMIVRLGMDLTGFSSGAKKATSEFSSAMKKISSSVGKIPKLNTKNLYQLSDEPRKEIEALNRAIEKQHKLVDGLKTQLDNIRPDGFESLGTVTNKEISNLEKEIETKKAQKADWLDMGWTEDDQNIQRLTMEIDSMEQKLQKMKGMDITSGLTRQINNFSSALEAANSQIELMENRRDFLSIQIDTTGSGSALQNLSNTAEETETKISALGKLGSALKGIPGVISQITHPIQTLTSKFPQLSKAATSTGAGVGNAFKTMLKYTVGIRSLYILFNRLRSALTAGFGNLAKESSQTNYALSTLKSSLTMLQNSFAAAFAPLVNAVAPMLASFIQTVADAISYVGAFFATLTGQGSYTRAVYNYQSIADSADSAASGTDAANKAAEEYQKTLAGFDEITKLDAPNSGSSGGSGGSGAGGGTGSGVSFETVSIPNAVSEWAEKLKEAWEKADFTEFGTIVGTKLKNALDSIDWPRIQEKCEKIAKSVATFLNGFFETEDLGTSIGKTIGNAFNTALDFKNTFMEAFHFDSLGSFITSGVQAALDEIDFSQITRKISNKIISIADFLRGCIEGVNWREVPQGIWDALVEAFNGIKWSEIAASISGLAGAVAGALAGLLSGIAQAITDNYEKIKENGGNIWAGICQGIVDAVTGIPQWVKKNLLVPFVDGFKSAFGIHSPASAPELLEAAGYVGEGILNGILQPFKDIGSWVSKNILTPIASAIQKAPESVIQFTAKIKTSLSDLVKGFTGKTIEFAAKIGTSISTLVSKFSGYTIGFLGKISTSASDIVSKFTGKTISFVGKISTTATTLVKSFTGRTISFKASISTKLTALIKKFQNQTISFKANITGFVGTLGAKVKKMLGLKTGGMYRNGRWSPIQAYASGGLPNQGQMFIAREAGPELVGSIGSGTAVMNNDQIVASVSAGVYKAVLAAMSNSNGGRQSDTINVYVGNDKLVASVIRGVNDITARTGSCPIHV